MLRFSTFVIPGCASGRRPESTPAAMCCPHPEERALRASRRMATRVHAAILRDAAKWPLLRMRSVHAAFPGCCATRRSSRRGALLIRGPCLTERTKMGPGSAERREGRRTASGTRSRLGKMRHLNQCCDARLQQLGTWAEAECLQIVITGFDPVIHLLRKTLTKMDGCPDQVRA